MNTKKNPISEAKIDLQKETLKNQTTFQLVKIILKMLIKISTCSYLKYQKEYGKKTSPYDNDDFKKVAQKNER